MTFDEFGFEYEIMDGLDAMNFREATPIQEKAIPVIMDGYDLIACAQTGTGKTAAPGGHCLPDRPQIPPDLCHYGPRQRGHG